jgi:diguanylate cyclase (GGDEF)-like protein
MLQGEFLNPAIQIFGSFLLSAVLLYLWRASGVVYFGFWGLALAFQSQAIVAASFPNLTVLHILLEFGFALAMLNAASPRGPRARLFAYLLLLIVYAILWRQPLFHSMVIAVIYAYAFWSIGLRGNLPRGIGGSLVRFSLICLCLQSVAHAVWNFPGALDLVSQTFLTISATIVWIDTQRSMIFELRTDLERLEQSAIGNAELDHLTGLQNRMALDRILDQPFDGVVAVSDLDRFKEINDHFGHLVGDEVLRGVGHLIRALIRAEDEAFRWGGDEFVLVFRGQRLDLARGRMRVLEERLQTFGIRGHGQYPLGLSWGAAEGDARILREVLEEADHQMYAQKRQAHTRNA